MQLSSELKQSVLVVKIDGDLIGENTGAEIVGHVSEKLDDNLKSVAIDLSNVRYMNSSGIGVLITLLTKITNRGGKFVVINPSEQINKLLEITKLTEVFAVASSEEDALSSIN